MGSQAGRGCDEAVFAIKTSVANMGNNVQGMMRHLMGKKEHCHGMSEERAAEVANAVKMGKSISRKWTVSILDWLGDASMGCRLLLLTVATAVLAKMSIICY
jgi:hypothetical protein